MQSVFTAHWITHSHFAGTAVSVWHCLTSHCPLNPFRNLSNYVTQKFTELETTHFSQNLCWPRESENIILSTAYNNEDKVCAIRESNIFPK